MTKPKRRLLSFGLLIAFVLAAVAAPFSAGATEGGRFGFNYESQDDH